MRQRFPGVCERDYLWRGAGRGNCLVLKPDGIMEIHTQAGGLTCASWFVSLDGESGEGTALSTGIERWVRP